MTTFTSYWQNSVDGMSVRGHQARLTPIENKLIERGWQKIGDMNADVALFDIFSEDFGLQMVRSSSAKMKVWIGNRTAQNVGKILDEVDVYADQDWGSRSSILVNNKLFISSPVVDETFLNNLKSEQIFVVKNDTVLMIPGGNRKSFMEQIDPMEFHCDFIVADNLPREELMKTALQAKKVICTPSVVAMELATLGVLPHLIITSVDQVGNFLNQSAMIRGFEGGLNYLVSQIVSQYVIMERKNG